MASAACDAWRTQHSGGANYAVRASATTHAITFTRQGGRTHAVAPDLGETFNSDLPTARLHQWFTITQTAARSTGAPRGIRNYNHALGNLGANTDKTVTVSGKSGLNRRGPHLVRSIPITGRVRQDIRNYQRVAVTNCPRQARAIWIEQPS